MFKLNFFFKFIARQDHPGQTPTLLMTLLVADIDHAVPCFHFNDSMSTYIGGVNNHLNCLEFFTGRHCEGRIIKVEAQEKLVSLEEDEPSETYYGMRLCGNDNAPREDVGRLKTAHVTIEKRQESMESIEGMNTED